MLQKIVNKTYAFKMLFGLCLAVGLLWFGRALQADQPSPSPDAIAIRVMPNANHYSPLAWYTRMINVQGAPQSLIVDGYEAVRDGRTVYVSAANIAGGIDLSGPQVNLFPVQTIYTNIYIISYNQDAEVNTQDVFGQILSYWKFNTDVIEANNIGNCQPASNQTCDPAVGCTGAFADYACENNVCIKKCLLSSDCGQGQYCNSQKAKLIRDVKRMADLGEVVIALNNYNKANKHFPALPDGSYLPDKTISVWPSWKETLSATLGYVLPLDPVNRLGACSGFDPITCWNESTKLFATNLQSPTLPQGSLAYVYKYDKKSNRYKFCTNFETNYNGLPVDNRCDTYVGNTPSESPQIVLGDFHGQFGKPFKSYVQVRSPYPIDWNSLVLTPENGWDTWAARGWQWDFGGGTGLNVQKVSGADDNTRSITARNINLVNSAYNTFNLTIRVGDIYGNTAETTGQVILCNQAKCQDGQCGNFSDGCGGTLLCGDCPSGQDCLDNKCISSQ